MLVETHGSPSPYCLMVAKYVITFFIGLVLTYMCDWDVSGITLVCVNNHSVLTIHCMKYGCSTLLCQLSVPDAELMKPIVGGSHLDMAQTLSLLSNPILNLLHCKDWQVVLWSIVRNDTMPWSRPLLSSDHNRATGVLELK